MTWDTVWTFDFWYKVMQGCVSVIAGYWFYSNVIRK